MWARHVISHVISHVTSHVGQACDQSCDRHSLFVLKSIYEPGKRHWLKMKKDYLDGGAMADTADLIVLGAYYGTGNKGTQGTVVYCRVLLHISGYSCILQLHISGYSCILQLHILAYCRVLLHISGLSCIFQGTGLIVSCILCCTLHLIFAHSSILFVHSCCRGDDVSVSDGPLR